MLKKTILATSVLLGSSDGFAVVSSGQRSTATTALHMGLFDGVKEAFSAPALERTGVTSERETPIDRWMGWSVASENVADTAAAAVADANFVDSMDASNYVTVELPKPMGIVFEENDADYGGIFVHSLKKEGVAENNGNVVNGDQLVAVHKKKVSGFAFDDALGAILAAGDDKVKLVFFRGTAEQFYGPTGASQDWLDEFIGVAASDAE